MRRVHAAALALSVAALGAGGYAGWRAWKGRRPTAPATPTSTATSTATATPTATAPGAPGAPDGPAAREAALLKALDAGPTSTGTAHATPTATSTATTGGTPTLGARESPPVPEPAPGTAAAREAKLLRSLDLGAAVGGPPGAIPLRPIAVRPQAPRISAESRNAADAAAELRAAFDARGKKAPTWPPLDESDPPPGPRLGHSEQVARKVARAKAAPKIEVPEKLDQWGQ